ncbi:MAG: hypothetical protein BMS9Abin37_1844 [Acidobacteriota bacterium]|nr:MAG: hypothetical protein BMS9Abin37_1844 [Acidobacteriota bacterium]
MTMMALFLLSVFQTTQPVLVGSELRHLNSLGYRPSALSIELAVRGVSKKTFRGIPEGPPPGKGDLLEWSSASRQSKPGIGFMR